MLPRPVVVVVDLLLGWGWSSIDAPPFFLCLQLFFSYFKELVGKEVTVELKNDLAIRGTLHSVDQYLNIKLENTRVVDQDKYPHMVCLLLLCLIVIMPAWNPCPSA